MGAGESMYVKNQEKFVKANIDNLKQVLPKRYYKQQIEGKLRQLYARSDSLNHNKNTYDLKSIHIFVIKMNSIDSTIDILQNNIVYY